MTCPAFTWLRKNGLYGTRTREAGSRRARAEVEVEGEQRRGRRGATCPAHLRPLSCRSRTARGRRRFPVLGPLLAGLGHELSLALQTLELLVRELDFERGEILLEVLERERAGDRQHHRRAVQQPGERYLRRGRAVLLRDLVTARGRPRRAAGSTGRRRCPPRCSSRRRPRAGARPGCSGSGRRRPGRPRARAPSGRRRHSKCRCGGSCPGRGARRSRRGSRSSGVSGCTLCR